MEETDVKVSKDTRSLARTDTRHWMSLAINSEMKLHQMNINNVIDVINNIDQRLRASIIWDWISADSENVD